MKYCQKQQCKVIVSPNIKKTWMLNDFIKAMKQQQVWNEVEILNWGDMSGLCIFFRDKEGNGFYISGYPIVAEIGSN